MTKASASTIQKFFSPVPALAFQLAGIGPVAVCDQTETVVVVNTKPCLQAVFVLRDEFQQQVKELSIQRVVFRASCLAQAMAASLTAWEPQELIRYLDGIGAKTLGCAGESCKFWLQLYVVPANLFIFRQKSHCSQFALLSSSSGSPQLHFAALGRISSHASSL
jgi:hypothetical protein